MAHSVFGRYNNFNKDNFNQNRHNGKLVEQVRPEKPKLRRVGDWSEQVSTAGKKYFYNCKTEVSQWEKPPEWVEYETKHGSFDKHRKLITDDIKSNESSHSASAKPCSSSDFVDEQQRSYFNNDRPSANYGGGGGNKSSSRRYYNKNDSNRYHHRPTPSSSMANDNARSNHNSSSYTRNKANNRSNDYANSYSDRSNQSDHSNEYRQRERWKRDRSPADRRGHSDVKNSMRKRRKMGNGEPSDADDTDRNDRVEASNSLANNSNEVDLERLPHLLVEIAERHNIDLSDPEVSFPALEKIKQHLKEALSHVVAELPTTVAAQLDPVDVHDTQTVLQSSDVSMLETKEDSTQVEVELPLATLSESHANFYKENLTSHVRNWSSIHFENQAQHLSDRSFQTSLDVAQISADLKCARSLVRTAEIRSTLLEQRISYLRQQHHQLDTLNSKPPSSTSTHA